MSGVVRAVAEAILAATPPTERPVEMVGMDGDEDRPDAMMLGWDVLDRERETEGVLAVRCLIRPDGAVDVFGIPVRAEVCGSFDLSDPQSFDALRRWLTDHGVPTAPIGAEGV